MYMHHYLAQISEEHLEQLKQRIGTTESRLKNAVKLAAKPSPGEAELEALKVIFTSSSNCYLLSPTR